MHVTFFEVNYSKQRQMSQNFDINTVNIVLIGFCSLVVTKLAH